MLQFSIYCKLIVNEDATKFLIKRIEQKKPKYGNVRCLLVTEKQYQKMRIITGNKNEQENIITTKRILEL